VGAFVTGDVVVLPFPFSADSTIVLYRAGTLRPAKVAEVIDGIIKILRP
jgi:hypothetical protein